MSWELEICGTRLSSLEDSALQERVLRGLWAMEARGEARRVGGSLVGDTWRVSAVKAAEAREALVGMGVPPTLLRMVAHKGLGLAPLLLCAPAHAAPDIGTTPGQDWLGALGLGAVLFLLFGGWRWLRDRLRGIGWRRRGRGSGCSAGWRARTG